MSLKPNAGVILCIWVCRCISVSLKVVAGIVKFSILVSNCCVLDAKLRINVKYNEKSRDRLSLQLTHKAANPYVTSSIKTHGAGTISIRNCEPLVFQVIVTKKGMRQAN